MPSAYSTVLSTSLWFFTACLFAASFWFSFGSRKARRENAVLREQFDKRVTNCIENFRKTNGDTEDVCGYRVIPSEPYDWAKEEQE